MFGLEIIAHAGGIYSTCTSAKRSERGFYFYVKDWGAMQFVILFLSHFLLKNTRSLGISGL